MTSHHGLGHSNRSLKWISFFWVPGSLFSQHLTRSSLFKVPASMSLQHLKDVSLIYVPVAISIGKWGGQFKTTKREIQDFMIGEL